MFAGTNEEARMAAGEQAELIDLEGRFVCSGFNDSHMHLLGFGSALNSAQLAKHTESLQDMVACLKEFAASRTRSAGAWIMGRGWNQDYFTDTDRMPDRYDLDQVSTEIPVCAVRACGHCLVVNSKALEVLGVTAETPQPEGGHIGIEHGEPDGRFFDNAMDPVYAAIPEPDKAEVKHMLKMACKELNRFGVTSSQTDD